jgi:hypothetical protein
MIVSGFLQLLFYCTLLSLCSLTLGVQSNNFDLIHLLKTTCGVSMHHQTSGQSSKKTSPTNKIYALTLTLCTVLTLFGCGSSDNSVTKVVTEVIDEVIQDETPSEPYATSEESGYSFLGSSNDFYRAAETLNTHAEDRAEAVSRYLNSQ